MTADHFFNAAKIPELQTPWIDFGANELSKFFQLENLSLNRVGNYDLICSVIKPNNVGIYLIQCINSAKLQFIKKRLKILKIYKSNQ